MNLFFRAAFATTAAFLTLFILCGPLRAQKALVQKDSTSVPCAPCAAPCIVNSSGEPMFDVHLRDGRVLQNYRSIVRELIPSFTGPRQVLRFYTNRNGQCDSTLVVPTDSVVSVSSGGLGSMSAPLVLQVSSAKEFYRVTANTVPASFLELSAFGGYGGTSDSAAGFKGPYEGVEILAAPFGTMLGEKTSFAIGGELLFEGGRMRIPAMGQLRYTIWGSEKIVDSVHYTNACIFACPGSAPLTPPDTSFHEVSANSQSDATVFLLHDRTVQHSAFRPFVFVEGAYIFNGSFTGAGANPSINPSDYGQYFFGGGIGTPFGGIFTASLGYRYMRLNLRTPCPTCVDKYILYTDVSNSVILKIGLRF